MKRLLRPSKGLLLTAFLAFAGLTLTAGPIPAAHAGSPPKITAQGVELAVGVNGSGFTPSSPVRIRVSLYRPKTKTWTLEHKMSVIASSAGNITAGIGSQAGTVRVRAYDVRTATWSNRATAKVLQLR
jgi:hypothetical protein